MRMFELIYQWSCESCQPFPHGSATPASQESNYLLIHKIEVSPAAVRCFQVKNEDNKSTEFSLRLGKTFVEFSKMFMNVC